MGLLRGVFGLALVVASFGCASETSSTQVLVRSVRDFNAQVRWGRTGRAASYLAPGLRTKYQDLAERLEGGLRVLQVDVLRAKLVGKSKAKVRVRFLWQRPGDVTVQTTVLRQAWRRRGKSWFLFSTEAVTGPMLPLLDFGGSGVSH